MKIVQYKPIGIINSPFKEPKGMPIQPVRANGVSGTVELQPEYKEGLKDLEGFSHIMLIYHFHLSEGYSLKVKPFLDDTLRGLLGQMKASEADMEYATSDKSILKSPYKRVLTR